MEDSDFQELVKVLEVVGDGLNYGISIVGLDLNIIWINPVLERKGFQLKNVKGTFYHKTFDNIDRVEEDDPTYRSLEDGVILNTVKKGRDNKIYNIICVPVKNKEETVEFVIIFTNDIEESESREIRGLRDFIISREQKMAELKERIRELEGRE